MKGDKNFRSKFYLFLARLHQNYTQTKTGLEDETSNPFILGGAGGRNRTADTRIFSPLLYRLSYPGLLFLLVSAWCKRS